MSYQHVDLLRVEAFGRPVGAIAPSGQGYVFEYEPAWRRRGIELAPILMPSDSRRRTFSFPRLAVETFLGLPPMLADSAPDRFGNGLIDAVLAREGVSAAHVTPLDRLAYVGSRGMGALTFVPDGSPKSQPTSLELQHLVEAARAAVAGDLSDDAVRTESLSELLSVGTSAGGARAKAVIAWNRSTNEMRAGGIPAPEGYEQWLLKFDGVGVDHQLGLAHNYGRTEYAYYLMATAAGISMAESTLLEEGGRAHFLTRRFDRPADGSKLHLQSLNALAALDFNQTGTHDYASLFTTARDLGLDDREQLFRRMTFNVLASNNDDHTKNHSFLMDESGAWSLAPAYDLTFAYNPASVWTKAHLMGVDGEFETIGRRQLAALADRFAVPGYRAIIAEVADAVGDWPHRANEAGVPSDRVAEVGARLDEVRSEFG